MDRMSTLDAEFLHLEDTSSHMHIAGVCTFGGEPPTLDDLRDLVASKLHLIPRYRQRVRTIPLDLGRPVWVDDPHFHLDYHVRHTALPSPGDDAEMHKLMGRLMSQPLDLDRPLWEAWLVEGLSEDRWALVFKVHHCMVDGIAGVGLLTVLLDLEPDAERPSPEPWEPAPEPSVPALVLDAWSGLAGDTLHYLTRMGDLAHDPLGALRRAGELTEGMARLLRHLTMTGHSSIEGSIGPHRVWTHASVPFGHVRDIRQTLGGTVNDVVLAAVTGGYRRLLEGRGDDPATTEVRSLVPVSVRGTDAHGVPDNRVSGLLLDLPVEVEDPVDRLVEVRRRMSELKGSHIAEAGELVTEVGNLAPPVVVRAVTRAGMRTQRLMTQRSITTVTTNVPGPQFPLYCLGREMLEYLPFVPISHGVRVGTAILSYNGRLAFGVTGDLDHAPDVDVLAAGIVDGLDELRAAAGDAAEHLVEGAHE
jgi:diacylglycerol O-acyltransferase